MRIHWVAKLLVATAGCLAGQLAVAQQTAIAPLAPLRSTVQQPASLGIMLNDATTGVKRPTASTATTAKPQTARPTLPEPVWLLNARIIVNDLYVVKPADIEKIDVYKAPNQPTPTKWWSLTEHGIIDITLKPGVKVKLKTESLAAIRRQLELAGPVSFRLNGLPLADTSLRVAAAAIAGLDVSRSDTETIVNIRLLPPKPAPPLPPGSIRIRGVAGR